MPTGHVFIQPQALARFPTQHGTLREAKKATRSHADCLMAILVLVSFLTALLAELSGAALGFGPAILYEP